MTIEPIVARYESGKITAHELAVNCLGMLDPGDPARILDILPVRALPHLAEFVATYKSGEMLALIDGTIPSPEQVLAAGRWLRRSNEPVLAPGSGDREEAR